MPRGRLTRALLRLAALAALVVLTGCRLDAELELVLDAEGGGDLVLAFTVDEALAGEAAEAGLDPVESLAAAGAELEGWQAEVDETGRAVTLVGSFTDAAELETAVSDLAESLAQPELAPIAPFEVAVSDRQINVTGGASLAPTGAVTDVGFPPEEAVAELDRSVDYRVAVTMPGEVIAHDGGVDDGDRRVVWEVPAGEEVAVAVTGERPRPLPLGLIAAIAAGVGVLALAAGWALRRR